MRRLCRVPSSRVLRWCKDFDEAVVRDSFWRFWFSFSTVGGNLNYGIAEYARFISASTQLWSVIFNLLSFFSSSICKCHESILLMGEGGIICFQHSMTYMYEQWLRTMIDDIYCSFARRGSGYTTLR